MKLVPAVELIYRQLSQPSPPKPAAPSKIPDATPAISLTWSDVDAILKRKRDASVAQLEYIIENTKRFRLTTYQRNDIGVRLTIMQANRDRPASDPTVNFLVNTLHIFPTPAGLLYEYGWVQRELRAGARAIAECQQHRPPRCDCWREARERLWRIQDTCGADSPEGHATLMLWEKFEEYERASRPERTAPPLTLPRGAWWMRDNVHSINDMVTYDPT